MAALELVGEIFVINTLTKGSQSDVDVAGLERGGFVATWVDPSSVLGEANSIGVVAQVFDANGAKIGEEFLVNSAKLGPQNEPAVTALEDGRFVIAWSDAGPANNPRYDVKAQIFAANGAKIGGEFTVNTVTAGTQIGPALSALPEAALWQPGLVT
jgi:hypothetical protein